MRPPYSLRFLFDAYTCEAETRHLAPVSVMLFGSCHLIPFVSSTNYFQIVRRLPREEKATSKVNVGRSVDLFPELNSGSCCEDSCFESHSGCSQQFSVFDFIFTAVHILIYELLVLTQSFSMKIRLVYPCLCQIAIKTKVEVQ